jgi:SAM-dependent methyltransferase
VQNLIKLFDENITFPLRWKCLINHLYPYLTNVNKVLDLGASCGRLACKLSERLPQIDFVGIDSHVQTQTYIPILKYNGSEIPYPDHYFDCVMMVDIIHHAEHPDIILKEAKRVTKKYILIKDHYWINELDLVLLKFADYIGNKPYGVNLPYNFLKIADWTGLTTNLNLKTIDIKKFRCNMVDPCRHIILHLEK